MSRLTVYWPDECDAMMAGSAEAPVIVSFPRHSTAVRSARSAPPKLDVVARARALFENRRCRHCGYPVVQPLELDDALVNQSGLEIPGTATLEGFRCCSCDAEWFI